MSKKKTKKQSIMKEVEEDLKQNEKTRKREILKHKKTKWKKKKNHQETGRIENRMIINEYHIDMAWFFEKASSDSKIYVKKFEYKGN